MRGGKDVVSFEIPEKSFVEDFLKSFPKVARG